LPGARADDEHKIEKIDKIEVTGHCLVRCQPHRSRPWFGALQLRYFGPRPLNEDNSQRSGSTTLAYLRAGYRLDRNWKLTFDVFNLFDRKASDIDYFYASRLKGEPAEGVNDIHFHPVEPRSLRISVSGYF